MLLFEELAELVSRPLNRAVGVDERISVHHSPNSADHDIHSTHGGEALADGDERCRLTAD